MAPVSGKRKFSSVEELLTNSRKIFLECSEILLKFANNVIDNPGNEKFRKIRVGNKHVQSSILPVSGGMQCLFEMGFEEDSNGEFLNLPASTPLDKLKGIKEDLEDVRKKYMDSSDNSEAASSARQEPVGASAAPANPQQNIPASAPVPEASPGGATASISGTPSSLMNRMSTELAFFTKMRLQLAQVLLYENPAMQFMAKRCVPQEVFRQRALKKEQDMLDALKDGEDRSKLPDHRDFLLLELLHWFKNDFFKWVDAPPCAVCAGPTEHRGPAEPTAEDLKYGANRVENYWCPKCIRYERFPRYNHPGKLLETRRGRCGEWANCFCLLCRTLGFETRYILDWTDHVWAEVYSQSQKRWMHCDPCEDSCDKPLTYEVGWGKKLTYVLAFAKDDVQDVTWRYTCNYKEVLNRRTECRENWLVHQITKLRDDRLRTVSEERRKELELRTICEIAEFFEVKEAKAGELQGRVSGSLGWRLARGETGSGSTTCKTGECFKLTKREAEKKVFHLRYCCASDRYERIVDGSVIQGWDSSLFEMENVFRKEEHDWKMVYLARTEGSASASIKWKFDFKGSGLRVDRVTVKVGSKTYESGRIRCLLCSDKSCVTLDGDSETNTSDLSGSDSVTLSVQMSGGEGNVAWQHTQLFRQGSMETSIHPLEIRITLK